MKYSRFSENFDPRSGILRLMDDLGNASSDPAGTVHMLGGGNPAMIPKMEASFRSSMLRILDQDREFEQMLGSYDAPQGNLRFINAMCELLGKEYGWHLTPDHIAVTNGSQASFGLLFNLFAGEYNDGSWKKILLPLIPEYIGYADAGLGSRSIFSARKPLITEFDENGAPFFKYSVDLSNLEIDGDTGAVCISRPTNPTGNVISDDEVMQLATLTRETDIPLIIDGAYGLPFPGMIFADAKPFWEPHIILCLSLSKLGLPGVRTGIIIADPDIIRLVRGSNAIFNLAPGRFGPTLVTGMLEDGSLLKSCGKVIAPYYRDRSIEAVKLVRENLEGLPYRIHYPEGAMFLWLWFQDFPSDNETLYQKLKERGVYVISGQHFFPGLEEHWDHKMQCIRVSYAGPFHHVQQGITIIGEEVRKLYDRTGEN